MNYLLPCFAGASTCFGDRAIESGTLRTRRPASLLQSPLQKQGEGTAGVPVQECTRSGDKLGDRAGKSDASRRRRPAPLQDSSLQRQDGGAASLPVQGCIRSDDKLGDRPGEPGTSSRQRPGPLQDASLHRQDGGAVTAPVQAAQAQHWIDFKLLLQQLQEPAGSRRDEKSDVVLEAFRSLDTGESGLLRREQLQDLLKRDDVLLEASLQRLLSLSGAGAHGGNVFRYQLFHSWLFGDQAFCKISSDGGQRSWYIKRLQKRKPTLEMQRVLSPGSKLPSRPARPLWLVKPGAADAQRTIPPECWGLRVSQWLDVVGAFTDSDMYKYLKCSKGLVSLHDMNDECVKPWTKASASYAGGRSISLQLNPEGLHVDVMVSHSWGEDLEECEDALMSFCKANQFSLDATVIWFCLFAQYQPQDGAGPSIPEQFRRDPFQSVIGSLPRAGPGMVAIHTSQDDIYSRLWCVHEIDQCLVNGIQVKAAYSKKYVEWVEARYRMALETGCSHMDAVEAAGAQVKTIKARCGKTEDEKRLFELIQFSGGFDRLDAVINSFRLTCFSGLLEYASLVSLKEAVESADLFAIVCAICDARNANVPDSNKDLADALEIIHEASLADDDLELPKGFSINHLKGS